MTTLLETPIGQISPAMLQDFQAKYPQATLRIEAADEQVRTDTMDEEHFWAIINTFDWSQDTSLAIMQPAVIALSLLPKASICQFHDILNEKLYTLDARRFAENLGSNAWEPGPNRHFSVDDFLYSRCGVVANGRKFYEEVLSAPELIPKEFTFESLLYLPDRAWKLQSGQDSLDYFPEHSYETFSNLAGWPGVKSLEERLKIR